MRLFIFLSVLHACVFICFCWFFNRNLSILFDWWDNRRIFKKKNENDHLDDFFAALWPTILSFWFYDGIENLVYVLVRIFHLPSVLWGSNYERIFYFWFLVFVKIHCIGNYKSLKGDPLTCFRSGWCRICFVASGKTVFFFFFIITLGISHGAWN